MMRGAGLLAGLVVMSCGMGEGTTMGSHGAPSAGPSTNRVRALPRRLVDAGARPDAARAPAPDAASPPLTGASVLTQHNDLARTGANLVETELNANSVASAHFQKLFARPVDDEIYAQPLLVSGLELPGRGRRNVLYVATVNDTVYAFDADDPLETEPLWTTSFLGPGVVPVRNTDMVGACGGHYTDFSGNIGIVGTPVIDPVAGTLYAVARTHEGAKFVQRLHALSLFDGSERPGSPVAISASVPGTGQGGTTIDFDNLRENQRPGLLLLNGVVYVAWAGHCDWGPYHGWVMGYDARTLAALVVHNVTPNGNAGGIWQSGQAPSSDGSSIFVVSGNGNIGDNGDPRSLVGRGESFMKLGRSGSKLTVQSWFTPYNYPDLEVADLDLGSAGMLLIPETHLAVSGGKAGWLYVVDRDSMGGLTASATADDNVVQTFSLNAPHNIHGSPVWWSGPHADMVYIWGDSDQLKAFPFIGPSYVPGSPVLDTAHVVASSVAVVPNVPGAMLSVSANGRAPGTGIIWASHSLNGNANQQVRAGILRAFDAETLTELWNSRDNLTRDDCGKFAKFSYPTVANGKVYLSSFSNQLCVYGLGS